MNLLRRLYRIPQWLVVSALIFLILLRITGPILLQIVNPKQTVFLDGQTQRLRSYTYPANKILIYQAQCSSKEGINAFLIACARTKKLMHMVGCELVVVIQKPNNMSDKEFWSIVSKKDLQEFGKEYPTLRWELANLDIMVDLGDLKDKLKYYPFAAAVYNNKEGAVVASCSMVSTKNGDIIASYELLTMIELATNNAISKALLSKNPDPDLREYVAGIVQPSADI